MKSRPVMLVRSAQGKKDWVAVDLGEVDSTWTTAHRMAASAEDLVVCREVSLARCLSNVLLAMVVACRRLPRKKDRRREAWVYDFPACAAGLHRPYGGCVQSEDRRSCDETADV